MNNLLTTEQLKKLITGHSLLKNLKALLKRNQIIINELSSKLHQQANKLLNEGLEILDQPQFLKDLEQLRVIKHHLRGIRLINFHEALKGETPRYPTPPPFDTKSWEEARQKKLAQIKK